MSDVVVIGGGIVGSSVAYHAALAGLSVTLFDRSNEGQATAAGAGIIAPGVGHAQADAHNALVAAAATYYPRLLEHLAADGETETGYAVVGGLLLATNSAEAEVLQAAQEFAEESRSGDVPGIEATALVDGRQAKALFPALADVPAALHIAGVARIDGRLMRDALQRAAQRQGAAIERADVHPAREGNVVRVFRDGEHVPAGQIVIAAGAWSAALGEALRVSLPVAPQRGQIAHLELPDTDTSRWPVLLTMQDHYLLTFPTSRVVVGATREQGSGFDYRLTAGGVRQVLDQGLGVAPGLRAATVRELRIGFRPVTPDGLPILGRLPGLENVLVGTGHGPTGLTMGPHAGAMLVDLMRGEPVSIDLAPYAAERFA